MSYSGSKSWMMNQSYDVQIRNTPAGVKARDLLSGKYQKEEESKLTPFGKASKDQKAIFTPVNLPQKTIHDYNVGAKTAGACLIRILNNKNIILYGGRGLTIGG